MTVISNSKLEPHSSESGANVRNGLLYLLAGGGIGAAIGLLFAPKPGSKFRGEIADWTFKGYNEISAVAETLKEKSTAAVVGLPEGQPARANAQSENILELVTNKPDSSRNTPAGRIPRRNGTRGRRSARIV